jgi:hypothetical protein
MHDELRSGVTKRIVNKVIYIVKKCMGASIRSRRGEECQKNIWFLKILVSEKERQKKICITYELSRKKKNIGGQRISNICNWVENLCACTHDVQSSII